MIALLIGHVPGDPGFVAKDLPNPEHTYNQLVGVYVKEAWEDCGFKHGKVIGVDDIHQRYRSKSNASIVGRQVKCKELGIDCAVEIHHDNYVARNDYSLVFYKKENGTSALARYIEAAMLPELSKRGIKRWLNVPLPEDGSRHPLWGKKWAVQEGLVPTVIFEPHSMADMDQREYFNDRSVFKQTAIRLALTMSSYWERYHGYENQQSGKRPSSEEWAEDTTRR